jgi:glycosyltransferase involved in cell wall biosynthesis
VKDGKYRVLLLCEHPVQYNTILWSLQARHPKLDILVAYCSLRGAQAAIHTEFGVDVKWDVPLLEGYPWILIPPAKARENGSGRPGFFSKELWRLVHDGGFDAIYVGGYYFPEAWRVLLAAKRMGIPYILSTDVHALESRRARNPFSRAIKKAIVGRIFRMAGAVSTGSSGATAYIQSLGVPTDRIILGRNTVDNDWWAARAAEVDRAAIRRAWNIPADAPAVLFCAKLQSWKRPGDLLEAFARADVSGSHLMFAGDGPLRGELERRAGSLGFADRVHFLGFVNQTGLPAVYVASDLMVLPSDYEPFGLVVNEAMICGCPVLVSDRVGAKYDLVQEGITGGVFPCGDVDALASAIRSLLSNRPRLAQVSAAARERLKSWTPEMNVESFVETVELAVKRNSRTGKKVH